jgi:ABC-2 type transport system ATP-binding protein
MDPHNRANLWDHINRLRERQETTIVLTTHYLEEADSYAERLLVIDHGVIIANDTAANLKATLAGDRITVTVDGAHASAASAVLAERGTDLASFASIRAEGGRHRAQTDGQSPPPTRIDASGDVTISGRFEQGTRALPWVLRELDHAGVAVRAADVRVPTLDDVFLSLTGRSLREEEVAA